MTKFSKNTIEKVLNNKATLYEAKVVADWFTTQEGKAYLKEIMDEEYYSNKEGDYDTSFDKKETLKEINKAINIRKKRFVFGKIAAVLIPFLLLSSVFWYVNTKLDLLGISKMQAISTGNGEKSQIIFQDGTRAYINPETTITFPEKFGFQNRSVVLNGEAYFDIAKNPNRPFIIHAKKSSVKVLGTSFLMTSYKSDENIKIVLDEGRIAFIGKNDAKKELKAGEKLIYNTETGNITVRVKHEQNSYNKEKDKLIIFENDNLKTVVKTLRRWYNVSFVVKDSALYNHSFTTTFKNNSIQEVTSELQKLSGLTFTPINKNRILIWTK